LKYWFTTISRRGGRRSFWREFPEALEEAVVEGTPFIVIDAARAEDFGFPTDGNAAPSPRS